MESSSLSFNNGIIKLLLCDYAGALTNFTSSIEEEPNNIVAYNNRGYAKNKLNDIPDEIADETKTIEIDPTDATAWFTFGNENKNLLY
jgi:tetratricopeptide (TPR) repeat protein